MRTEAPSPLAQAAARLRAPLDRARRRLAPSLSGSGWALGAAALLALAVLAWAATVTSTSSSGLVRSGGRFSEDDLITVRKALDAKSVRYRINDNHQVEVAVDRLDEANAVVAKLQVGPRPIDEIERASLDGQIWDSLGQGERRQELAANERLAALIRRMEGIVWAHVEVKRPKARGLRAAAPATAFVYLETRDERELPTATIDLIQSLINGAEPDVKPDAIAIYDNQRPYLNPKDPSLNHRNRTKTYRDELRQQIEAKLDWLKGAQVSVQVTPPPPVLPAAPAPPPTVAAPPPTVAAPPPVVETAPPPPAMGVNQPLELAPEPVSAAPAPAPTPVTPPALVPTGPTLTRSAPPQVRVCVSIPRSYFVRAVQGRESSLDDLQPLVERTKTYVDAAVRHIVPPDELDEVTINNFPDEVPATQPSPLPASGLSRLDPALWLPIGVAAGAALATAAVALGMLAARRPAPRLLERTGGSGTRGRYKIDEASDPGPGPSERVRELIKLSPEAAASVLHRWTRGGPIG
jgi:type III secretory pathway lipoprotein EscJ